MLLAIDSSTECISVGTKQGDSIITKELMSKREQSEKLPSLIKELVLDFSKLTGIVVGIGPGSLTGTRIALSIAKGISQGLKIPLIGESSLEAQKEYLISKGITSFLIIIDKNVVWSSLNELHEYQPLDNNLFKDFSAVIDNTGNIDGTFTKPQGFAEGLLLKTNKVTSQYSLSELSLIKPLLARETKFLTEAERAHR